MFQPLVTAVIPCHNHELWVAGAIASVSAQDYEPKSIVVVDDGSTDGSLRTILSCLGDSPKRGRVEGMPGTPEFWRGTTAEGVDISVLHFPSASGPSFARNRGVQLAVAGYRAEVIAFLDSDDVYHPGKISGSIAILAKSPQEIGAVYSDYDTLREDGLRLREFKRPFSREGLLGDCLPNANSIVTVAAMERVGGFDEEMRVAEDYCLWIRISEHFMIAHLPESLITIRVGPHSSTANVKSEVWAACRRRIAEKMARRARG